MIYQMEGLFMLYNNGLPFLYNKLSSKGRKLGKTENIVAIAVIDTRGAPEMAL